MTSKDVSNNSVSPTLLKLGASPLIQSPLPFDANALEGVISEQTIGFHYGKHHKGYFDNLNKLVAGTPLASASLEEIVVQTVDRPDQVGVFNNAAQAWNHNFYWLSLTPKAQTPSGALAKAIDRDFGSLEELKKQLAAMAVGRFGSGWAWLVAEGGKLKTVNTLNAAIPFENGQTPLLTVDVWEHAYYLDYQNRRADHVSALLDATLNWDFAAQNFEKASA
jgi:Fe-Mn family superoxide dismutase